MFPFYYPFIYFLQSHKKSKKKHKSGKKSQSKEDKTEEGNEIDLWLVTESEKSQNAEKNVVELPYKKHDNKKSKHKKSKNLEKKSEEGQEHSKHRKKLKKSKEKNEKETFDYEETAGISTPSKEILPNDINLSEVNTVPPSQLPTSMYKDLAKDKTINMVYELKQLPLETNKVVAAIILTNMGDNLVKELVFNVSDTSSLKLDRRVSILS